MIMLASNANPFGINIMKMVVGSTETIQFNHNFQLGAKIEVCESISETIRDQVFDLMSKLSRYLVKTK